MLHADVRFTKHRRKPNDGTITTFPGHSRQPIDVTKRASVFGLPASREDQLTPPLAPEFSGARPPRRLAPTGARLSVSCVVRAESLGAGAALSGAHACMADSKPRGTVLFDLSPASIKRC